MIQAYVPDTSTLLNLIRGKELGQQIDAAFGLRAAMYRHTISIVTHGEMRVLVERNNWGNEKRRALNVALDSLVSTTKSKKISSSGSSGLKSVELDLTFQSSVFHLSRRYRMYRKTGT